MFSDMTPRYVPNRLMTLHGMSDVVNCQFAPRGHNSPVIRKDMGCLTVTMANGVVRYFGCDRAYINSRLEMVVIGCNANDIARMGWTPVAEEEL